jgi:DNA polymerase-1
MSKTLYLLDTMALVYRAHFAFIQRPILTSKGMDTSALFGFTQTLLDLRQSCEPSHLAVVFDTPAPTARHRLYPEYKAQREAMPEALSQALPHVRRMVEAFRLPVLALDGYEADDVIGTLVRRAEREGFECYMVTPDKDFGQLVTERVRLYRPGRLGQPAEILGPQEVCTRWGIREPAQVIDVLALMGDASDNIPGVPGIGEKTAAKLIAQFGGVEDVLARRGEIKGKLGQNLETHQDLARLSKQLATIDCAAPIDVHWEDLEVHPPDEEKLKALLVEFEFNAIGRRVFGETFRAGRGQGSRPGAEAPVMRGVPAASAEALEAVPDELPEAATSEPDLSSAPIAVSVEVSHGVLRVLSEVAHRYRLRRTAAEVGELLDSIEGRERVGLAVDWVGASPRQGGVVGLALASAPGEADYVAVPTRPAEAEAVLAEFRSWMASGGVEKVVHDAKRDMAVLRANGWLPGPRWFDTMLAHGLAEPELRHSLEFVAESMLGRSPMKSGEAGQGELGLDGATPGAAAEALMERADLALQLAALLEPRLQGLGQERVFRDIEMPLVPVLVAMEQEGIRLEPGVLEDFSRQLSQEMAQHERAIHELAGVEFNVNSPKQLGDVLFERLRLLDKPRKTRTGQYATDEATLLLLAEHEIVRRLLEYRTCSKLKSTYADALPAAVDPVSGRVHTTYQQLATATGRLNSQNPNLQNIPIRTDRGQEIRRAFVPRAEGWVLLSADYSQIELRIIAALGREAGLLEAFRAGADVHTATAARVFGVAQDRVTPDMRKKAKMVNYGIAYGISAFGLAHCRSRGYVETVTGRRRYLRDIRSANATVRQAAERNAINAPIQGTAADMIKLAMVKIQGELDRRRLQSRMLLQVHDELVFDVPLAEREEVEALVEEAMRTALPLDVPIEVGAGTGANWLEAH